MKYKYKSLIVVDDALDQELHEKMDRGVIADEMPVVLHLVRLRWVHP